ncbi:MAG: TetR/AcrR family transcriptional regulator [Sandaracinaceae bacterium]|nr:TetR/AcrR family transcriptional regulator [Sandaracinaceae bacterium]
MASGKRRGRPRKFVEEDALDAITDLFWRQGFAGTSLEMLSASTGVGRPSLYATFGEKEAMYVAALQNFFARVERRTGAIVGGDGAAADVVRRIFESLIELYTSPEARGCLVVCTAPAEAASHEVVQGELRRVVTAVDGRFAAILEKARARGELSEAADPTSLAAILAAVTHTLAVRARAGVPAGELRAIADAAVELVFERGGAG